MKLDLSNQIDVKRAETYLKKLIEQGAKVRTKETRFAPYRPAKSLFPCGLQNTI